MQHILTLYHSDEVSGTTILSDGTKLYWTEGYSPVVIVYADGRIESVDPFGSKHPVIDVLLRIDEVGHEPSRLMTPQEEAEHDATREAN